MPLRFQACSKVVVGSGWYSVLASKKMHRKAAKNAENSSEAIPHSVSRFTFYVPRFTRVFSHEENHEVKRTQKRILRIF